jgi:hypothetical protein
MGSLRDGDCLEDLGIRGRIILILFIDNYGIRMRNVLTWLRIKSSGGPLLTQNGPLSFIKAWNFWTS